MIADGGWSSRSQYYIEGGEEGNSNRNVIVQRTVTMFIHWDFTCSTASTHFVANYAQFCKQTQFYGVFSNYYNITQQGGGSVC